MTNEGKKIEDKATPIKKEWEDYARKGNWTVKGYEIVRAPSGPGKIEEAKEADFMVIYRPHGVLYHHSYGLVSKFFQGLISKKLLGTKCPHCETVYCPPRVHCWNPSCKVAETEWIELPLRGKVHTFSVMLFSADAFLEMLPFVLGYVQLEGAHTALPIQIMTEPTNVFIGQKVKIKFREKRNGDLMDIYAVPAKEQVIPQDSCLHKTQRNISDLERDLENTNAFLEKRFGIRKEEDKRRSVRSSSKPKRNG
jgi:uncharacterized OB-fold protein